MKPFVFLVLVVFLEGKQNAELLCTVGQRQVSFNIGLAIALIVNIDD